MRNLRRVRHLPIPLLLVLLLYACLSLWLTRHLPPHQAPDEGQHLEQIERVRFHQSTDFRALPRGNEAIQPPLYYGLAAALSVVTDLELSRLRLLSTCFGLLTIWLTWRLGREWMPHAPPVVPLAAAAAVGFVPMNLYLCSAVNNDSLANLLVALGLLLLWRALQRGFTAPRVLGLSAVAGLALMAKSTGLALLLTVLAALLLSRLPWRRRLLWVAVTFAGLLLVAGWWMLHNQRTYGDPLAASAIARDYLALAPGRAELPRGPLLHQAVTSHYLWQSFWGVYDGMLAEKDFMPWWIYHALYCWLFLGLLGLVLGGRQVHLRPPRSVFFAALLAGFLVLVAGYLSYNLIVFSAQGRYFFGLLPPLFLLICWGLSRLVPVRHGEYLPVLFSLSLLGISVWALTHCMV